jgi:DNA adenine methylase
MHDAVSQSSKPKRPVLRYHGGKWQAADWIIQHLPPHRIYVEPYCGAASVFMRKEPSFAEVINDRNDDIVNLFRVLRDPRKAKRLAEQISNTPWARTEFWAAYDAADSRCTIERARRMIVRSYMAFGTTGQRKNRSGFRGTGERKNRTGINDWVNYPDSLRAVTSRLRGVLIENRDALEVIKQQDDEQTLFYCDPPYVHSTRTAIRWPSDNNKCYEHEMKDADHEAMSEALHACQGMVVLSGYHSKLYDRLFKDWQHFEKKCIADGAKWRTEVLWLNPAAAANLRQQALFI